ncbi:MAG TPA: CopD family protein [Phenylobacterium sp.]|uniref:CopD family protein n=1 Tax=Phenylobacterium sp. TaxID=1871053 RepID=UPI002B45AB77|nr:CopD family protein [Phenylobacterium sp.]HKR90008.1 CopD family protein [Phenylobacterium sp.]
MNNTLDWPLLVARFTLLAVGIGLFGQACFDLYAPASLRRPGRAAARVLSPLAATLAALAWLAALGREIAGAEGFPSLTVLAQLCSQTGFGQALAVAALFGLALTGLALSPRRPARVRAALSAGLLASLAFVGHAAGGPGGFPAVARIGVMAIHLLAAGVWLGGFLPLILTLPQAGSDTLPLLRGFGRVSLAAVALLVTSGMITAFAVMALAGGAPGVSYLATFGLKLALVAALLALASLNRWRLTPLAARDPVAARRAFAWTVAGEQVLALGLIAVVTLLGQIDPSM